MYACVWVQCYPTLAELEYPVSQNILNPRKLGPRCDLPSLGTGRMFVFCSVTSYPRRLTATRRCPMHHDRGNPHTLHSHIHSLQDASARPQYPLWKKRRLAGTGMKPWKTVSCCSAFYYTLGILERGAFRTGASQPTGCWSSGASSCSRGSPAGLDANLSQRRPGVYPKVVLAHGKASARAPPGGEAPSGGRMRDYVPPAIS